MKKIPSIFRKKYTSKKLQKKILKKLFIPADKTYIESLFVEIEKKGKKQIPIFAIPSEIVQKFDKKEKKRLKIIAKQIKKQKGRINFVPLVAALAVLAAIPVGFLLFKNKIIKLAITNTCESIFEARCDIQKVDFKLLDSSLRVNKIEIADKDNVMKNLVDIGSVAIDFDLGQLLKKHFVVDELSVLEVNSGTDRSYPGSLPPKKEKKIKQQKEKKEKQENKTSEKKESKFDKLLADKKQVASSSLEKSITGMFGSVNPEAIIQSYYAQLQTPSLAENLQTQIPLIVTKWEAKPGEVQKTVTEVQDTINQISSYDYQSIADNPMKIKEFIESINSTYQKIESIKNETNTMVNNFNSDIKEVDNLRKQVQGAVTHDIKFADSEIKKIKSLNISDGTKLISGMFENVACDVLGKYYPYVTKGVNYLLEMKAKQAEKPKEDLVKTAKKKKGYSVYRAPGRDVIYHQDKTPTVWIKKLAASGPIFSAQATDISNNQDLINKPAVVDFNMDLWDVGHTGKIVVDFRSQTTAPLVRADYQLKHVTMDIPAETFGGYPGVPSFNSSCDFDFVLNIFEDEGFDISGNTNLKNLKIETVPFEPEFASKIYSNIMARINSVTAGVTSGYTVLNGFNLKISSDADKQVINALKKEMDAQMNELKENIRAEVSKYIQEASQKALGEFGSIEDIKTELNKWLNVTKNYENILNNKKAECENYVRNMADEARRQAEEAVKAEAEKQINNAIDEGLKNVPVPIDNQAADELKNQFKKFKF